MSSSKGMREPSFVKSLFFGVIDESLIFPWPAPDAQVGAQEVARVRALLESTGRFFEREVDSAAIDRERRIPDEVLRGLKALGLFGLLVPRAQGGVGLTTTGYARVIQEVGGLDPSVAVTLGAHQSLGVQALVLFGSEELKALYLPRLARGELVAAFALTESGAGSDAAAIQTRADRAGPGGAGDGGDPGWTIQGSKRWITNGAFADLFVVFARTSPPEEGVKPKITAFVVERGWGITSGPEEPKLGVRGSSTTDLALKDVRVPASHVLGEPGRGFRVAMQVLSGGRLGLASGCVGVCKRLIRLAVDRCRERRAFGRPIGEFGLIKDKIATMMAETWALESMTYLTTAMVDAGFDDHAVESALCKIHGSEACWRVANETLQIAAGLGYTATHPYERWLRDARVNMVFEGTNEILRAFVALSGMQGPGRELADVSRAMREPIKGFGLLSDFALRKARGALGRERLTRHHPRLQREAAVLEEYAQELARSVEKVLRKHGRDIAEMQYTQKRVAALAVDLYGVAACLTRTSAAIERRGEEGARREIDLTSIFVSRAEKRMEQVVVEVDKNDDELRKAVASRTYDDGGYPFDVM
ncbi:MAG TPA: acyl-CoA dehydrogenase family protein [Polyangiaceae bacterium]|jgi:acyl-CoA dehydrogenase family protein 9